MARLTPNAGKRAMVLQGFEMSSEVVIRHLRPAHRRQVREKLSGRLRAWGQDRGSPCPGSSGQLGSPGGRRDPGPLPAQAAVRCP